MMKGTCKWFSNKKGYGFITPDTGSLIQDDVFVHQSSIKSDGYRTLIEGWEVEFTLGYDSEGKPKAENVTAPGGGPCSGARKPKRKKDQKNHGVTISQSNLNNQSAVAKSKKEPPRFWHHYLHDTVKTILEEKSINTSTGTMDISVNDQRIKLGTNGYASMATSAAILAEGAFTSDPEGKISFEWKRAIRFLDTWNICPTTTLISNISLTDSNVTAVGSDETMNTLMGQIPDPKSTLEASGFQMRRVVLTAKKRGN